MLNTPEKVSEEDLKKGERRILNVLKKLSEEVEIRRGKRKSAVYHRGSRVDVFNPRSYDLGKIKDKFKKVLREEGPRAS